MNFSLTSLLIKLFVKNKDDIRSPQTRASYGTLSSIVGIAVNMLLSLAKLLIGTIFGSIAITADATNNLSDAGSQIVSFISFKISAKPADRDHPFGHARIEYVASMIVSFLILNIGVELMTESVKKIFSPDPVKFSPIIIAVLAISVICKLWLVNFKRFHNMFLCTSINRVKNLYDSIYTTNDSVILINKG